MIPLCCVDESFGDLAPVDRKMQQNGNMSLYGLYLDALGSMGLQFGFKIHSIVMNLQEERGICKFLMFW